MKTPLLRAVIVVLVNFIVLLVLFGLLEFGFRTFGDRASVADVSLQWQHFRPYVMFSNPHNPTGSYQWIDSFHGNRRIAAQIANNSEGFATSEKVDFAVARPKEANERIVLFTGGSAAWGVGATSNSSSVAGQLEKDLNEAQSKFYYRVFNLAMGGWNAFQQYIALSLYGRNLQPDWLVSMDGTNDVAIACAHSQGAGNVMHYALMDAYISAYTFGQVKPVFYRGWLENEVVRYSVAYRKLTGKTPINVKVLLDTRDPGVGRSVILPTTWIDVERQLYLYIQTEAEMIDLFPRAKVLLSTQPLPQDFVDMYGHVYQSRGTASAAAAQARLDARLKKLRESQKGKACGLGEWPAARLWFMPVSALKLEALAKTYRHAGRSVYYVNPGVLFPASLKKRKEYFIDPVHMNNTGMASVAKLYARVILASDFPGRFTMPRWTGEPLPVATPEVPILPGRIEVLEASYGQNCKNFKVPAPHPNTVKAGNATGAVRLACTGKQGTCTYLVDVAHLGDPANSCGKDFSVKWRCGATHTVRQASLPGESNGRAVNLSCPEEQKGTYESSPSSVSHSARPKHE